MALKRIKKKFIDLEPDPPPAPGSETSSINEKEELH